MRLSLLPVLDKLTEPERDLIQAMVTDGRSDWPQMPASMPVDTQPDDVARASLYYSIEAEEIERRPPSSVSVLGDRRGWTQFCRDLGAADLRAAAV